eukprot:scaffold6124_cov122-Cylindrotheca_fusiformis.AAC.6
MLGKAPMVQMDVLTGRRLFRGGMTNITLDWRFTLFSFSQLRILESSTLNSIALSDIRTVSQFLFVNSCSALSALFEAFAVSFKRYTGEGAEERYRLARQN